MTTAAVYIRQTESGPPPDQQRAECVLAIENKGWTQTLEFLDAESFTGRAGEDYGRLLTAMRAKRIEHVVAYSAERMFRGMQGMVQLLEHARVGGVHFFLCLEGLSTDGNHGAYLVRAAKLMAEIDFKRRSERVAQAMMLRKQQGLPVGTPRKSSQAMDGIINDLLDEGVPACAVARKLGIGRGLVRMRVKDRVLQRQE